MMRRGAGFSLAVACALAAATAAAQSIPGNPSRPGMPVKTAEINLSDEVTAIGCLARDDRGRFLLNDAGVEVTPYLSPNSPNATGPNGPTGGSKTSKPFASKTSFTLKFDGLQPHVGHTIEVTGKLEPATANLEPTPDTIGGRGRTANQGDGTPKPVPRLDRPHMNVVSMKMISTSCTPTR